jgi:hypothetical protein
MAEKLKDVALAPEAIWYENLVDGRPNLDGYYVHPKKCMNPQTGKWRWIRHKLSTPRPMLRKMDGTAYAFRCQTCGGIWKVYQNAYHGFNCPHEPTHRDIKEALARGLAIAKEGYLRKSLRQAENYLVMV